MLLLLLVASVPVVGIAGANAFLSYEAELAAGRRTAAILGEVAATRHGAILQFLDNTLRGLAQQEEALNDPAICSRFLRRMLSVNAAHYSNVWVTTPDGRITCSALPPRDVSLAGDPLLAEARTDRVALSGFRTGRISGEPVLSAVLAAPGLVVGASLRLSIFEQAEAAAPKRAAQRVWLVDREGTALPLTTAAADELPDAALLRDLASLPQGGAIETRSRRGDDYAYASARLDPGLGLLVGLPTGEIRKAAHNVLLRRAMELAAFLLACLVVIVLGADLAIARPLRLLAARVRQWRPGAPFAPVFRRGEPDEVRALEQAFADAAAAISGREEELRGALRQRDLLMAEIHHRVKNNLQIVASLLNLQANRLRDPTARAEFATARDRVQALATLHRHLYTNQTFEVIALRPFLEELAQQLFAAIGERPGQRIRLTVEADELEIVTDQAVSLALLVTETVTNAIKHGFPDARSGSITIAVRSLGEEAELRIHDDGLGMRLDEEEGSQGIGLTLIRGFAAHLGGEIVMRREDGTELLLRFPLRRREADQHPRATPPQPAAAAP
ncbi:sensor histidine kinase [Pseudoroseomonas cervicalis]|uniref:sensor histidine kinase n=1 Tax=Teichococcus cervicalis TaxID=204525 RepID=UPI00278A7325|nr:histidine kinase dimerization/phosphoacceptor domain -containing protein [Pseudoroseomonas cervicalis]MDQ1080866.1 two-component sensor histidine kinase [Pseudoroseomonas cervicalis]